MSGTGRRLTAHATALVAIAGTFMAVTPPALAGTCSLQATVGGGSATEVPIGEEVLIEGFGFPAGDVEVSYEVDGAAVATETVSADGAGTFETTVTPAAGQAGTWTVSAVDAGETCTAETGFLVLGAASTTTPTPTRTAAPSASGLPNVAMEAPAMHDAATSPGLAATVLLVVFFTAALAWTSAKRRLR